MSAIQAINPRKIRIDLGTQMREKDDFDVVEEYAGLMEAGKEFPPIVVYHLEGLDEFVLVDGFHRLRAHCRIRSDEPIQCKVREGTLEDAQWEACAANATHGVRRTNADKAKAVKAALLHTMGAGMSDSAIARYVGVDHKTVAKYRGELETTVEIPKIETRTVTRNGTTYQQGTGNIGRGEQKPRPVHPQRKLKGSVNLYIPPDNAEEAATEFLHRIPLDYLDSIFAVIDRMEADPEYAAHIRSLRSR